MFHQDMYISANQHRVDTVKGSVICIVRLSASEPTTEVLSHVVHRTLLREL